VKVANEFDRCSRDAQDLLLTMLDRMPPGHAFLATTNLDIGNLTERLQTRFLPVRLQPPENEAIAAFLARRWAVPIEVAEAVCDAGEGLGDVLVEVLAEEHGFDALDDGNGGDGNDIRQRSPGKSKLG
jgi:hypothetical protein